jgi:diguanylate cyclase (GGDEF)-like protein
MTPTDTRDRLIDALSALVLGRPRWVSIGLVVAVSIGLSVLSLVGAGVASDLSVREILEQGLAIAIAVPLVVSAPVSAVIVELVHALQREHHRALEAAQRDELTGLPTRRHTLEVARRDLAAARRAGRPFSVALIDLDDFKRANDVHGHATGDALLRAVADACRTTLRDEDIAGRWGGEEFLVLLPGTDAGGAVALMERLRVAIAATRVELDDGARLACTASIGVATLRDAPARRAANDADATAEPAGDAALESLVAAADRRMYTAKATGKNRVAGDEASAAPMPAHAAG